MCGQGHLRERGRLKIDAWFRRPGSVTSRKRHSHAVMSRSDLSLLGSLYSCRRHSRPPRLIHTLHPSLHSAYSIYNVESKYCLTSSLLHSPVYRYGAWRRMRTLQQRRSQRQAPPRFECKRVRHSFWLFYCYITHNDPPFGPLPDLTELDLPATMKTHFPDPADLLNFSLTITPDEGPRLPIHVDISLPFCLLEW